MNNYPLETIRHSAAHVMAAAVQQLYPDAKFDIGPATENGFYYDFDMEHRLLPEDLKAIEKAMKKLIGRKLSLYQVTAEEGTAILRPYTFQYHALKGIGRLYHTRLGGIALHMFHVGIICEGGNHAVRHSYGAGFKRTRRVRIAYLDMRAETDYLIAYLALETDYHRHGNNHHRQPDSNTDSCYQHGRTGNLLSDIGTAVNTQRYETG